MFKCLTKIGVFSSVCLCFACSSANNKPVFIGFNGDSTAIIVTEVNQVGLLQLKNNPVADSTTLEWVSVIQEGKPIKGRVALQGDTVFFIPEKPLEKGKTYLVSTSLNAHFGGAPEIFKSKISYHLKPQQKTLVR